MPPMWGYINNLRIWLGKQFRFKSGKFWLSSVRNAYLEIPSPGGE